MKIGVIGGSGFIGSEICKQFTNNEDTLVNITESGTSENDFDILINANGNPYKYIAEQNPLRDFSLAVESVYRSIIEYNFKRYIYISSIDAEDVDNNYGRNRFIAESIVRTNCEDYLIIRLCSVIGKDMKKGVVSDILEDKPSRLTLSSQLYLITVDEVARKIFGVISKGEIKNQALRFYSKLPMSVYEMFTVTGKTPIVSDNPRYECYFVPGSHIGFLTSEEYLKQLL
jgi:dTDP-4-dehydrorhamnose reductase